MDTLLAVSGLKKTYIVRKTAFSLKKQAVRAVDGVSFVLEKGGTLGIVGESGSGKSTLARCVLLLEVPDEGKIEFLGEDLVAMEKARLKRMRRDMQIIFQDPYSSLNPRKKVLDAIAEPMLFHGITEKQHVRDAVVEVLKRVGLDEDSMGKFPYEMSGGQRQRVAIGRALATNPALIVADEPVSSLDVSIQAQIVNLFMELKSSADFSMLFVSHDLNIVRFVSDNIIVMYSGRVVEAGCSDEVFRNPLHPYTRMLIASIEGEFTDKTAEEVFDHRGGCIYSPRCNLKEAVCSRSVPELAGGDRHAVACFMSPM
jgi:peptide/nickel transport system ATP-binding protein